MTPKERSSLYYRENREQVLKKMNAKKLADLPKFRLRIRREYLNRTYGPGAADYYEQMFDKQNGRCAICGKQPGKGAWGKFHQDHDTACCPYSETSKTVRACGKCRRGLLCSRCNAMLSSIERPGWLRSALRYVKKWQNVKDNKVPIVDLMVVLKRQLEEDQKRRETP